MKIIIINVTVMTQSHHVSRDHHQTIGTRKLLGRGSPKHVHYLDFESNHQSTNQYSFI